MLRREVGPVVGGDAKLSFDILRRRMSVVGAPGVSPDGAVARTGMHAQPWTAIDETGREEAQIRYRRTLVTAVSGV